MFNLYAKFKAIVCIVSQILNSVFMTLSHNRRSSVSLLAFVDSKSMISKNVKIYRFTKIKNSTVGEYTYICPSCSFNNTKIGKFCSIASGVKSGMGKHPINYVSSSPSFYSIKNALGLTFVSRNSFIEHEEITIGNDVWIGSDVIILDGVNVGDGAIIAAKALVNKSVPPYAIVGGIPARVIKFRFEEKQISELLKIAWWNLSDEVLKSKEDSFNNVDAFIEAFKNK